LWYKSSIPEHIVKIILDKYDSQQSINMSNYANADWFDWILSDHNITQYNSSISYLVKLWTDPQYVPEFTDDEIQLVINKYNALLEQI